MENRRPRNYALRAAREKRGWSLEAMAERVITAASDLGGRYEGTQIDPRSIRRWEAGERQPRLDNVLLLCHVLDARPGQLGLVRSRRDPDRTMLDQPLLDLLLDWPGPEGWEAVAIDQERMESVLSGASQVDDLFLDDLERTLGQIGPEVHRAPMAVWPALSHLLGRLQSVIQSSSHVLPCARRLRVLAGEANFLAACGSYNLGNLGGVNSAAMFAEQMAAATGEGSLQAMALMAGAFFIWPDNFGSPNRNDLTAHSLLTAALEAAGPDVDPSLRAWILSRRSVAAAFAGLAPQADADLEAAARALERAPACLGHHRPWPIDAADLESCRGKVALLGHARDAAEILASGYAQTSQDQLVRRALVLIDLALAHLDRHQPESAYDRLAESIVLARQHGLGRILIRVAGDGNLLPSVSGRPGRAELDRRLMVS